MLLAKLIANSHVMGWSMGGFVAQEMMAQRPDRIRRVILSATNPGGSRATLGPKWAQEIDSDSGSGLDSYLATNFPLDKCGRKAQPQDQMQSVIPLTVCIDFF